MDIISESTQWIFIWWDLSSSLSNKFNFCWNIIYASAQRRVSNYSHRCACNFVCDPIKLFQFHERNSYQWNVSQWAQPFNLKRNKLQQIISFYQTDSIFFKFIYFFGSNNMNNLISILIVSFPLWKKGEKETTNPRHFLRLHSFSVLQNVKEKKP